MARPKTLPADTTRAALYVRVSTAQQAAEGLSLEAPEAMAQAYCPTVPSGTQPRSSTFSRGRPHVRQHSRPGAAAPHT
jgi:hypothetical protein